jgi:hypothetical protein
LLKQHTQMGRLGLGLVETGGARLCSRTDRRAGEDGGHKNFTQDCPLNRHRFRIDGGVLEI